MTIRIPDPKANTTTEAYLAYKAGYLEESELKPSLYEPYLHFDAWLAYWAGLTNEYPVTISKKNLFGFSDILANSCTYAEENGVYTITATGNSPSLRFTLKKIIPEGTYALSGPASITTGTSFSFRDANNNNMGSLGPSGYNSNGVITTTGDATYLTLFTSIQSGQSLTIDLSEMMVEAGDTRTSYEPYSTPEMLCDEEALVAYLAGVTDTYPEDIKDPYDVRIVGYLKHLASIRWPEPDYPVNNEEFYLSTMEPTHTSNSEPSADIELDTAEGKIISVEAYGDTKQQTYTGKNLFNKNASPDLIADTTVEPLDTGIRVKTSTAGNYKYATYIIGDISQYVGKNVVLKANMSSSGTNKPRLVLGVCKSDGSDKQTRRLLDSSGSVSLQIKQSDMDSYPYLYIWVYANVDSATVQANDYVDYTDLQIEISDGTTPTAYEPYVGGIPAPNPDYPQDVNVVTGEQIVKITGKNLAQLVSAEGWFYSAGMPDAITQRITVDALSNNSITFSVTQSGSYVEAISQTLQLKPSTEYTLSFTRQSTFTNNQTFIYGYDNGTYTSIWRDNNTNQFQHTFTTPADGQIRLGFGTGASTGSATVSNIQIEAGSTPTAYEPYQSSDYEINLGKNLFSGNYSQFDNAGGTGTSYAYFKLPTGSYYTLTLIAKNDIEVQSPQKYIGFTRTGGSTTSPIKWAWNGSSSASAGDKIVVNNLPINDIGMPYLSLYPKNEATLNWFMENFDIQLELGDTGTSYAPYFEPIELCKIGNYQDYIYKDGDDWYLHKPTGKVTYKGTEKWTARAGKEHTFQISAPTTINGGFSNYFTTMASAGFDQVDGIYLGNTNVVIVSYPTISSVEDFKTWLSTHNLIIYYGLFNTPTDTKITNDALIGQLEALANADTYDEKTYIRVSASDPNLPALLKVEAYKY